MQAYLYTVAFSSSIWALIKIGILIGAKKYGDEDAEIGTELIGLIPFLTLSIWGITIIFKG